VDSRAARRYRLACCYDNARKSLEALRYYLILCRDLGFNADCALIEGDSDRLARVLGGLASSVSA
jgi:hypothetical protein